jgi:hypothetical protein
VYIKFVPKFRTVAIFVSYIQTSLHKLLVGVFIINLHIQFLISSNCPLKVKLSLGLTKHHTMKTYWRSRDIVPHILALDTPRPLYPQGNRPRHPLNRKMGVSQSRSGHGEEKIRSVCRESNPDCPFHSLFAIPTELSRH